MKVIPKPTATSLIEPRKTSRYFLIAYSIFSLYRNTKTIHSIMMIWLVNFIVSNYKLASGPPKDPGGVKNIFSKSKDIDS